MSYGPTILTVCFFTGIIMLLTMAVRGTFYQAFDDIWLLGRSACAVSKGAFGDSPDRFVRVAAPTDGPGGNAGRLISGSSANALTREMDANDINWRYAYDIAADARGNCALSLPDGAGLPASPTLLMTPSGDFIALELAEPHEGGDLVIDGAVNKTEPPVIGLYEAEPGSRALWLYFVPVGLPLLMLMSVIFCSLSSIGVWWESAAQFTDRLRHATIALSAIVLLGLALQLAFTFVFGWDFGGIDGYRHAAFWPSRGGFAEFVTSFGFTVVAAAAIMYARFLLPV